MKYSYTIRFVIGLLVSITMMLLIGCVAFGSHSVKLTYEEPVRTKTASNENSIYVGAFVNSKDIPQKIASLKTVHGSEIGTISASNDIATWARDATIEELAAAGYPVIDTNQGTALVSSYENVLTCNIKTVYSNAYTQYEGEVSLQFKFVQNGKVMFDNTYSGYGNAGSNLAARKEEYARSVTLALKEALGKLLKDITHSFQQDATIAPIANADSESPVMPAQTDQVTLPPKESDSTNVTPDAALLDSLAPDTGKAEGSTADKPADERNDLGPESFCSLNKQIIILSGSRKEEDVFPTMNSHSDSIQALHTRRSSLKNDIAGSVCIYIKIKQDGNIEKASILQSTLEDNLLESQILEYVSEKIYFPESTSEEPSTMLYKVAFYTINVRGKRVATSVMVSLLIIALSIVSLVITWKPK